MKDPVSQKEAANQEINGDYLKNQSKNYVKNKLAWAAQIRRNYDNEN